VTHESLPYLRSSGHVVEGESAGLVSHGLLLVLVNAEVCLQNLDRHVVDLVVLVLLLGNKQQELVSLYPGPSF
jgi:hypothetical protein